MIKKTFYLLAIFITSFTSPLRALEYFVDSENGSDRAAGTSEGQAWRTLEKVNTVDFKPGDIVRFARGGLWRGSIKPKSGADGAPVVYTCYGSDDLPKPRFYGSISLNRPADWVKMDTRLWRTTDPVTEPLRGPLSDVGNLIFDGSRAGVKCWTKGQLTKDGRFWHDPETRHVWIVSAENPAETCRDIEAALRRSNVIDYGDVHHALFSNLDVRYGGAHGFGGGNTSHITIRDCDISWIGGGHLTTWAKHPSVYDDDIDMSAPGGVAIRYGNGIEFWKNAHDHLVEGCRLWEIYDTAISNQGDGKNEQRNITYRNNVIWNCENSYEYWDRYEKPDESITENIFFTNNTCLNAGCGWGHTQRPNPNGCHVLFYGTMAKAANFIIAHNVFANATEYILRVGEGDWAIRNLHLNNNVWSQQQGDGRSLVLWQNKKIFDFQSYQKKTGLDQNSLLTLSADVFPVYKGHDLPRLRGAMIRPDSFRLDDLDLLAGKWKANHVRWQLIWSGFPNGPADTASVQEFDAWIDRQCEQLDRMLPELERYGVRVTLDLHTPPGGRLPQNEGSAMRMFREQKFQDTFVAVWQKLARKYKDVKVIWCYDLLNEAVEGKIPENEGIMSWRELALRTSKEIRKIDPVKAIVIEPAPWGSPEALQSFEPFDPKEVPNVVYSVHMYLPHRFTHQGVNNQTVGLVYPGKVDGRDWDKEQLRNALQIPRAYAKKHGVAIYIGEFGSIRWAPDNSTYRYLKDCIEVFEEEGWDWAYHAFREWDGWSVEHGFDKNDHQPTAEPTDRELLLRSWFEKNER